MKTIHTDKYGLLPWALLGAAAFNLSLAYRFFPADHWIWGTLFLCAGLNFLRLAVRRFLQVRQAKAEGRDPAILRVETK